MTVMTEEQPWKMEPLIFKVTGLNFAQIHNRPHWRELGNREQERLENHTSFSLN